MVENLKARGRSLIEELKNHVVDVVKANSGRGTLSLEELRDLSGLEIRARTGESVWDKALLTLVVELIKEGRLRSTESLRPLESKYAAKARYSVPRS